MLGVVKIMLHRLERLKGVRRKFTDAEFIRKANEIEKKISQKIACTSAGDNGAINIWFDDKGKIRCEAMRWCKSVDSQIYDDLKTVKVWAKKWLSEIGVS